MPERDNASQSPGLPGRGRGNGLPAESYLALVDLRPTAADALLEALRQEGVAAWAAPPEAGGLAGSDRVWVDATERELARAVLRARWPLAGELDAMDIGEERPPAQPATAPPDAPAPGEMPPGEMPPGEMDEDALWRDLVAAFESPDDGDHPWPDAEDVTEEERRGVSESTVRLKGLDKRPERRAAESEDEAAGGPPRDWELAEDPDGDHYVPPEPPPIPHADVATRFGWLAVLGGPVLLVLLVVFQPVASGWLASLGVLAFIGGFVTLVTRMRDRDDEDDDDPHGGAVV